MGASHLVDEGNSRDVVLAKKNRQTSLRKAKKNQQLEIVDVPDFLHCPRTPCSPSSTCCPPTNQGSIRVDCNLPLGQLQQAPVVLKDILTDSEGRRHRMVLQGHLPLAAWPMLGNPCEQATFRKMLSGYCGSPGGHPLSQLTQVLRGSGALVW